MWRRGIAFLIDLIPIGILAVFENALGIADQLWIGVPNLVLVFAYFVIMNYRYGGTLGKQFTGLRVALPQSPQVKNQLMIRCLVKLLCLLPPRDLGFRNDGDLAQRSAITPRSCRWFCGGRL